MEAEGRVVEAKEVQAEFDTLTAEKLDLEEAIKTLRSGIAGLSFALKMAAVGDVLLLTKKERAESNTNHARGGIAGGNSVLKELPESPPDMVANYFLISSSAATAPQCYYALTINSLVRYWSISSIST